MMIVIQATRTNIWILIVCYILFIAIPHFEDEDGHLKEGTDGWKEEDD